MGSSNENEVTLRLEAGKARPKHEGSDDDDDAPDLSGAPLFAELGDAERDKVDHVIAERLGPVREGQLGRFEPDVTEEQIFERCGGGKYRLQCRTSQGKPIKKAFVTVDIAGEPVFQSDMARRLYKRMTGDAGPSTAAAPQPIGLPDIVALLASSSDRAEDAQRRRESENEARHRRDMERIEAEAKLRSAERAADDERRRRDDEERRLRDKREQEERDDRRRREDEAARERDRQHQAMLLQITTRQQQTQSDPIATLLAGVNLVQKITHSSGGGEGPGDPLTAFASTLPQTVQELGKAFRGGSNPDELTLEGELGKLGQRAVKSLEGKGYNVAAILAGMFQQLEKAPHAPRPAPTPTPAAGAQAAAAPAAVRRGPGGRVMPQAAAASSPPAPPPANGAAPHAPDPPAPPGEGGTAIPG